MNAQKIGSFWLVSAPAGSDDKDRLYNALNQKITKHLRITESYPLRAPEFKVGTLDKMMELSDDVAKLDTFIGQIVERFAKVIMDNFKGELQVLNANNVKEPFYDYVQNFQWNQIRYTTNKTSNTLPTLLEMMQRDVTKIESDMKKAMDALNEAKQNLAARKRKEGNLLTRDLTPLLKDKPDMVVNSENLCTLMVVVSKFSQEDFLNCYETLAQFVIPRSAVLLAEETDLVVYRVVLFRRIADEFTTKAREKRFIVRDIDLKDLALTGSGGEGLSDNNLVNEYNNAFAKLDSIAATGFSDTFAAWTHVKVIRLFVESVLRYGLPANFMMCVFSPQNAKQERSLKVALNDHYKDLANSSSSPTSDPMDDDLAPYVSFKMELKK